MADWLTPASICALIAIAISAVSLAYTRKVERRQAKLDQPTVSIDLIETAWVGWYRMIVSIRNRTDAVWMLESVDVPNWEAARLAEEETILGKRDALGSGVPRRDDAQFDRLTVNRRVAPSGAAGPGEMEAHFLISVEKGFGSHSVGLEARLRSLAEIRAITIHVQRVVTP